MDRSFDLVWVGAGVGSRIREIFGSQTGIGAEKVRVAYSLPATLLQNPNGDACSCDHRGATAYARSALDARESVPKIADYPLEKLGLLRSRQP
jgi:hypothetical protein